MSITKGAMLISNANAVGTELVNQLGGTGYKPVEWSDKINLLGINSVDAPYAIKSIQAGTYTGEERGVIQYSNCNAVGSMLNKKLNTNRGFKPVEWPSSINVLKPLTENTVTGDICAFSDGADDVPTKSLVVTIPPTLNGYSSVDVFTAGTSYGTFTNGYGIGLDGLPQTTANRVATLNPIIIDPNITYKVYSVTNQKFIVGVLNNGTLVHRTANISSGSTINTTGGTDLYVCMYNAQNNKVTVEDDKPIVFNSTETITTYTASLGRTIYGGQADIVNGEGTENCTNRNLVGEGFTWSYNDTEYAFGYFTIGSNAPDKASNKNFVCEGYVNNGNYRSQLQDGEIGVYNNNSGINRFCVRDDSCTTLEQFLEKNANTKITYEVTTTTAFTFTGQEVNTRLGYNAFWSEQGDTEVTYYQAPQALTRSTVSGSIASFSDADTRLTCVNAIATIPPSIDGTDTVQLVRVGKNLFDKTTVSDNTWIIVNSTDTESTVSYLTSDYIPVKANTKYYVTAKSSNRSAYYDRNKNGISYFSFSGGASFTALYDGYIRITIKNDVDLDTFIINEGDTQETYEAYNATTYTANLPSINYGGSVDFVNGDVVNSYNNDIMTSTYLSGLTLETYIGYEAQTAYFNYHPSIWVRNWHYQDAKGRQTGGIGCVCNYFPVSMHNTSIFSSQYRIYFDVDGKNISSVADFIAFVQNLEANNENLKITYELATPTTASITGQAIIPKTGTNNCYNNVGGNTEITYFTNT